MMNWLWNENGWQIVNAIVQNVIAMSAWVTIILTKQQVSSTTKVKLKMYTEFQTSVENGKAVVEIVLHIINLGMASVYIEEWGIALQRYRGKNCNMSISKELFELEPGKPYEVSCYYPINTINDKASLRDKVRIYVRCRLGEIYYSKQKFPYYEFKHDYQKIMESVDSANKEIEKMINI